MASFAYRGRSADGATVNGRVEAPNLDAAAEQLFGNRITPLEIREAEDTASGNISLRQILTNDKITDVERITFARQMHNLTKAGLPLDRAIRGLEASLANQGFKRVLREVVSSLERGNTLAEALAQHPKVFNDLFISLVNVGENTGRLDLAFADLAKYIEIERTTSKQLKSATRYPMFVLAAMAGAIAVITVFVIPAFSSVFNKLGADLPWQTRALIATSDFAVGYWPLILSLLLVGFSGFRYWSTSSSGAVPWDRLRIRLPLVGGIFERIALARFAKTFAIMGRSGVPVVRSLNVVSEVVGNKFIGSKIADMSSGVTRGESLYLTAQRSGIFLPLVLQMIAVGEESGNLPDLLDEVSDFYDGEIEYDLNRLTESIEPILIIFIAILVLILALGVFLPIWDLAGAAR
jgi:MSHA biogenesis protein MshG